MPKKIFNTHLGLQNFKLINLHQYCVQHKRSGFNHIKMNLSYFTHVRILSWAVNFWKLLGVRIQNNQYFEPVKVWSFDFKKRLYTHFLSCFYLCTFVWGRFYMFYSFSRERCLCCGRFLYALWVRGRNSVQAGDSLSIRGAARLFKMRGRQGESRGLTRTQNGDSP